MLIKFYFRDLFINYSNFGPVINNFSLAPRKIEVKLVSQVNFTKLETPHGMKAEAIFKISTW